jgi:hypothetical protein
MKIIVLGCGPAGLIAAEAAASTGASVSILSNPEKSRIGGAQYLHNPIPGVTPNVPSEIFFRMLGAKSEYALKVYGDALAPCSFGRYKANVGYPAWSLQETYDVLWNKWNQYIKPAELDPYRVKGLLKNYDLVISSIAMQSTCLDMLRHSFVSRKVWIQKAPPQVKSEEHRPKEGEIVYNGLEEYYWYRACKLYGEAWTEYPGDTKVSKAQMVEIKKPRFTDCTCFEHTNLLRVGRFGRWDPKQLVHMAWPQTIERIINGGGV